MRRKGPVVVLTSKIVYNTGKFIVNVYEPPGLLFLNGKKKAKEEFFFFFLRLTRAGSRMAQGNLKSAQIIAHF